MERQPLLRRPRLSMQSILSEPMVRVWNVILSMAISISYLGAHSWVRRHLGIVMEGDQTGDLICDFDTAMTLTCDVSGSEYVWGVTDVLAETDFPDLRFKCVIQSSQGAMLVREIASSLVSSIHFFGGSVCRSFRARKTNCAFMYNYPRKKVRRLQMAA